MRYSDGDIVVALECKYQLLFELYLELPRPVNFAWVNVPRWYFKAHVNRVLGPYLLLVPF